MVSVGVIGAGVWGLALAAAAARTGKRVLVHTRRHPDKVPEGVEVTDDFARIGKETRLILLAVPSRAVASVCKPLGDHLDGSHWVVHGIRGLVARGDDLVTVSDVVREETPARRLGALGGPVVADDLLAGRPSVMVCGSPFREVCEVVEEALAHRTLRVYSTDDLRGLEWASALVGCLALGVGYAEALSLGSGLVAAVICRAIEEAGRIAAAAGGNERTLLGLAGYGDLLACIEQKARPEVRLGAALARGEPLDRAIKEAGLRVEAIELIPQIVAWAERHDVRAPILSVLTTDGLSMTSTEIIEKLMMHPRV